MPAQNGDVERLSVRLNNASVDGGSIPANLSAAGVASVAVLKTYQEDYEKVNEAFHTERRALEDKYTDLYKPIFAKRSTELAKDVIPKFWLGAFSHCEEIAENIQPKDTIALEFLKDLTVTDVKYAEAAAAKATGTFGDGKSRKTGGSYTLTFSFAPNPFFENTTLTKTYIMEDDEEGGEDGDSDHAIGDKIQWKAGKDLTHRFLRKKIRGGKGGKGEVLTKKVQCDSFFNFFEPPVLPEDSGESMTEEELDEFEEAANADVELGETFRHDLIPRAIAYYLDEVEVDTDEDEDEDGSDDEDEYEAPPPPLPPAAQSSEDCKQQ